MAEEKLRIDRERLELEKKKKGLQENVDFANIRISEGYALQIFKVMK